MSEKLESLIGQGNHATMIELMREHARNEVIRYSNYLKGREHNQEQSLNAHIQDCEDMFLILPDDYEV